MKEKSDIGLVGLAVMGENLILYMANHGYTVTAYNRSTDKVDNFINGRARGKSIRGAHSIEELVDSLSSPRKIMLMVKAGPAVDAVIEQLMPLLDQGDIIIDGGNTHFPDTNRRVAYLKEKGLLFIGTGVSGGEEGALTGPSIMPGGSPEAWPHVKPIFQHISAKVDDGTPCCDWVGEDGAGHFVKMVHNGIEYGDMQLICEAYQIMKELLGMSADEMHEVFAEWNQGDLDSYLIEISRDIMAYKDADGEPLVEKILDTAGQKGTGKWTGITALDLGVPLTLIGEAVFARCLSAQKDERVAASKVISGPTPAFTGDKTAFIEDLRQAVFHVSRPGAKMDNDEWIKRKNRLVYRFGHSSYYMGQLLKENGWNLNYGGIALMWRGGCIIRSAFLGNIKEAFDANPDISNLLLDDYFRNKV